MLFGNNYNCNKQTLENIQSSPLIYSYTDKNVPSLLLLKYKRDLLTLENQTDEILKCRGVIVDTENMKEVCHTFNSRLDYDDFKSKYNIEDVSISIFRDGTMLNLFHYNDEWHLSTKSRISALKSKWKTPKSFQELFEESVTLNYDNLNTNYCYSFILLHRDNKIVVNNHTNMAYLSLVRDLETGELVTDMVNASEVGENVFPLEKVNGVNSYTELEEQLVQFPNAYLGYVFTSKNGDRTRQFSPIYTKARDIKGNDPITSRYFLSLLNSNKMNEYLKYYPENKDKLDTLKSDIKMLCQQILKFYFMSRKHYIEYPKYLSKSLYNIHLIYIDNKKRRLANPKINLKTVLDYFYGLNVKLQFYLISTFRSRIKN